MSAHVLVFTSKVMLSQIWYCTCVVKLYEITFISHLYSYIGLKILESVTYMLDC